MVEPLINGLQSVQSMPDPAKELQLCFYCRKNGYKALHKYIYDKALRSHQQTKQDFRQPALR